MNRPIHRIKLRTDEVVDLIFVENSCKACTLRAQPRFHLAVSRAGEYNCLLMEADCIDKKT
jgi:hypothetical protein